MTAIITGFVNAASPVLLTIIVLGWLVLRAVPEATQFLREFVPMRRRLSRARIMLETLKIDAETIELAKKYNIAVPPDVILSIERRIRDAYMDAHPGSAAGRLKVLPAWKRLSFGFILSISLYLMLMSALVTGNNFSWNASYISVLAVTALFGIGGLFLANSNVSTDSIVEYILISALYILMSLGAGAIITGSLVNLIAKLF